MVIARGDWSCQSLQTKQGCALQLYVILHVLCFTGCLKIEDKTVCLYMCLCDVMICRVMGLYHTWQWFKVIGDTQVRPKYRHKIMPK